MKELIGKETKKVFKTNLGGKELKIYTVGTPRSTHFKNVRSEFSKEDWDKIRKQVYRDAKYKCEICGEKGTEQAYKWPVECHEIWDYNWETKEQKLIGFIALCPRCHKIVHFTLTNILLDDGKISPEEFREILKHFNKVNELSPKYKVDDATMLNINFHRNKHNYKWDINTEYANEYLEKL